VWLELKEYVRFAGKTIIVNMAREAAGAIRLKSRSMYWLWSLTIKKGKPVFAGLVWKSIGKNRHDKSPATVKIAGLLLCLLYFDSIQQFFRYRFYNADQVSEFFRFPEQGGKEGVRHYRANEHPCYEVHH